MTTLRTRRGESMPKLYTRCAFCGGSGTLPFTNPEECPLCGGLGEVMVEPDCRHSIWITSTEYAKIFGVQGHRPLIRQENHRWQTGEESLYRVAATREVRKKLHALRRGCTP